MLYDLQQSTHTLLACMYSLFAGAAGSIYNPTMAKPTMLIDINFHPCAQWETTSLRNPEPLRAIVSCTQKQCFHQAALGIITPKAATREPCVHDSKEEFLTVP